MTLDKARQLIRESRAVYAEWHDGAQRRERVIEIRARDEKLNLRTIDGRWVLVAPSAVMFDQG